MAGESIVEMRVEGLAKFRRELGRLDKAYRKAFDAELKAIAQPIAREAQSSYRREHQRGRSGRPAKGSQRGIRAASGGGRARVIIGNNRFPYLLGQEWGTVGKYPQFPPTTKNRPADKRGYFFWPAVIAGRASVRKGLEKAIDRANRRAFPEEAIVPSRALTVVLAGNSRGATRSLDQYQSRLKRFGGTAKRVGKIAAGLGLALGAAAIGGAALSVKRYAQLGDTIHKMGLRTGFSAEALSELAHAAELSGTDINTLEGGIRRMQRTIYDAEQGLSTAVDGLDAVGRECRRTSKGKKPEKQFDMTGEGTRRRRG